MTGRITREISVESHQITGLVIYEVSIDDLNQLEAETLAISEDFSFAVFCITAAFSFTATLATVDIPPGKIYQVFWVIIIVGYLAGAFFGVRWFRARGTFKRIIKRIKERPGPLGEEGQEIDAEELESLTSARTQP
jgi:hypothetical protein